MADTQTAEQWSQAASKSREQLAELTRQFANIDAAIAGANEKVQETNAAVAKAESLFKEAIIYGSQADIEKNTLILDEARSARDSAVASKDSLGNYKVQYETRVGELNAQINDADNQSRLAQTAPDGASVNTPPVSTPDANVMAVAPTPTPISVSTTVPNSSNPNGVVSPTPTPSNLSTTVPDGSNPNGVAVTPTPTPSNLSTTVPDSSNPNGVIVTPVPEPTVSNVFITEFDPDPAPFAREIGAFAPPIDETQESVIGPQQEVTVSVFAPEPIAAASNPTPPIVDDGTGGFRGTAIADNEATSITISNGITIKTQEFANTAVTPEEDPFEQSRLDAEALLNEPGPTEQDVILDITDNGDGAAEGGNTAGDFLNEPPVVPNEDGAAEGGNTVGNIQPDSSTTIPYRGPSRDDDGNLMPGWEEGEFGDQYVGDNYVSVETQNSANESRAAAVKNKPGLSKPKDWRVRISLAPGATYFYGAKPAGILSPLQDTDGVIFPYTPTIQVNYSAKYDTQSPTHSNYNIYNYQGSSVEGLTITGEFTAQSVTEANYLLAVIHFFKSATKMFYGKDAQRGTPPPLLYLSGYGQYQFDNHPMVLTSFNYSLPQDVDYVDAYSTDDNSTPATAINGVSLSPFVQPNRNTRPAENLMSSLSRLISGKTKIEPGGTVALNSFKKSPDSIKSITRVPSKISITLTLNPMVTRRAINDHFSLKEYATGKLLRGSSNKGTGGGIW